MAEFVYLEAVNLDTVISDTEDLSTRRGGGYMLLELVHRVSGSCDGKLFKVITSGASAGLFELREGVSMKEALAAIDEIRRDPLYAQATTIVINTRDERVRGDECQQIRERLLAAVRLRQLQSLSVVTAFGDQPPNWSPSGPAVCEVDGVRPAVALVPFKPDGQPRAQSRSVSLRREAGRALRRSFYRRELDRLDIAHRFADTDLFTDDLEELARFDPAWGKARPSPLLEHKIAVIYADGNGFGTIGRQCASFDELRGWDRQIQSARRMFLHQLLQWIEAHPHGLAPAALKNGKAAARRLRIETLMWGGDEFMVVVPAWLGLQVVRQFFSTCRIEWPPGRALTHSVGLVLAHRSAPISSLQHLAKGLADYGKVGRYKGLDSLHWTVLESFDHAGSDLDAFWQLKGMPTLSWSDVALNPIRLSDLLTPLPSVAAELPRSSLHRIVHSLGDWSAAGTYEPERKRLLDRAYGNVHSAVAARRPEWARLWKALQPAADLAWPETTALPSAFAKPEHLSAWLTLVELWDYVSGATAVDVDERADLGTLEGA